MNESPAPQHDQRTTANLWAPWRLDYVTGPKPDGCVFCRSADTADLGADDDLVVARGERGYVVMNRFPYNNGHLMVVPNRHVADLNDLTLAETNELQGLLRRALHTVRAVMNPEGCNIGLNLGAAAGAGIAAHLHWHLVPRWNGDTNFMPVLADTNVIPQALQRTRDLLAEAWVEAALDTK